MHQYTAIARLGCKAIRHFQPVIFIHTVSDEVSSGSAEAHQETIADNEWVHRVGVVVHCRHIHVPAAEVFAIE